MTTGVPPTSDDDDSLARHVRDALSDLDKTQSTPPRHPSASRAEHPERVGHFRILEPLGEGGMGTVYLAEQTEPVRRRVALKLIKLGMDTKQVIARFESERQALAMMNHPGIAAVYDAGVSEEGRPYFVMEYVAGVPITEFCDKHRLSIGQRLGLFMQVCDAVQHAHQKGIIHRDIKPSNVLVAYQGEKPAPKIIDFGVAKATNQRLTEQTLFTEHGQIIGTPEYMSPEQAEMSNLDIDTRTDIYSLGVMLYELLVGALPFDPAVLRRAGYAAIQRMIREVEPPKPSTRLSTMNEDTGAVADRRRTDLSALQRVLRGDLDWITMKALDKDRGRRYASATEFAADLARYLGHEPVLARPPSTAYRLRKFVRKHRGAVTAGGLVFVTLLAGIVGVGYYAAKARDAELTAKGETEKTKEQERETRRALLAETDAKNEADRQKEEAKQATTRERAARAEAEENAYFGNMTLAHHAFEAGNMTMARARLRACPANLRHWEWRYLRAASDGALAVLRGHEVAVKSAAFSPDGRRVVTASFKTARVWDADSGECLTVLRGHESFVVSATFSPDGRRVVTGSVDTNARIWDAETGEEVAVFLGHEDTVNSAAFSPDGRRVVTASSDKTARVFDAETGEEVVVLLGHEDTVNSAAFSPDGRRVITASNDETARIWDVETRQELAVLRGHECRVDSARFSPDGRCVVTTPTWGVLGGGRVWNAETGNQLPVPGTKNSQLRAVSSDGRRVLSELGYGDFGVWDVETGAHVAALQAGHHDRFRFASFAPSGQRLICIGVIVTVWDAESGERLALLRGHDRTVLPVNSAVFSPDGRRVLTASPDGTARIWDADRGEDVEVLREQKDKIVSTALSADGRRIVAAFGDKTARISDTGTGEEVAVLVGHEALVKFAAFSPDGRRVVTASVDKTARVWDAETGEELAVLREHEDAVLFATFSPNGRRLATASDDKTARVWDAATGEQVALLRGHQHPAGFSAFSPDSRRIVTASIDGTASVWDAETGQELAVLRGPGAPINSAAFSPDGERVVTASADSTARIGDVKTGEEFAVLRGHSAAVDSAAFSPDGQRVITTSDDGTKRAWGTMPYRILLHNRAAATHGGDAARLVDRLWPQHENWTKVANAVHADAAIGEDVRRAALDIIIVRAEERRRVAAGDESDLAGLPGVGTPAKADDEAAAGAGGGGSDRP